MKTDYNDTHDIISITLDEDEINKYSKLIKRELKGFYFNGSLKQWESKKLTELHPYTIKVLNQYNWMYDMTDECKEKVKSLLDKNNEISISYDEENKYFIMKCSYENRKEASDNNFKWNKEKKVWYSVNLKDVEPLIEYMDEKTKSKIEEFREIENENEDEDLWKNPWAQSF